jgi:anti-sigma regulatory factor (Ser/Thr protein kinase)
VSPSKRFLPEASSAAAARTFVRCFLRCFLRDCPPDIIDSAVVVTSELVTNALVHARSPVEVDVTIPGGSIRIAVTDASHNLPKIKRFGLKEHGRGLPLVTALSDDWGAEGTFNGKTVWASLHVPS